MASALDNVYFMRALRNADAERLHELRLRGSLAAPDESAWAELAADGLVVVDRGRVRLTPEGHQAHAGWALAQR